MHITVTTCFVSLIKPSTTITASSACVLVGKRNDCIYAEICYLKMSNESTAEHCFSTAENCQSYKTFAMSDSKIGLQTMMRQVSQTISEHLWGASERASSKLPRGIIKHRGNSHYQVLAGYEVFEQAKASDLNELRPLGQSEEEKKGRGETG